MRRPKVRLDPKSVRQWLKGQARAQRLIEEEKRKALPRLAVTEALQIYLELRSWPGFRMDLRKPSPVLMAMRNALRQPIRKQR